MIREARMFGCGRPAQLAADNVHIWSVSPRKGGDLKWFVDVLSSEERARAEKFAFERDRRTFIVCRGALRHLISLYASIYAARIHFRIGPQGKPSLAQEHKSDLKFNVSHSGDLALLAFSLNEEIGVDIEFKRTDVDFAGLAESSFSRKERDSVLSSRPDDRANLFYEIWSCKEACIKADGRGLSIPLDQFYVAGCGTESAWREIISEQSSAPPPGMRGRILQVGEDYAAAVMTSTRAWQMQQFELEFA